jgi:hypothetical protein
MTEESQTTICCICENPVDIHYHDGVAYWTTGHNAEPLAKGRCCDACNRTVLETRMFYAMMGRGEE